MSGKYEEGWDAFPSSPAQADIIRIMQAEGWYFPQAAVSSAYSIMTIETPGRYGYGGRLVWNFNPNNGPVSAIRLTDAATTDGWISTGFKIAQCYAAAPCLIFYDAVHNARKISIVFDVFGVVKVYSGGDLGQPYLLIGESAMGQFHPDEDFDVEAYCKIGVTTGEVEVRIHTLGNGGSGGPTPAVHFVNIDTDPGASGGFTGYGFGWAVTTGSFTPQAMRIDDFRFYDSSGSANNSWLGTCRVQTLLAAGNGATTDFTRSNTGLANWQNIVNKAIDDTLYLYDPTVGDFNLSTVTALVNSPTVFWVGVMGFYRQDDATQRFVKNRIVSGTTTTDGPSFATPQSYLGNHSVFDTDPNTGLQFLGTAVNALSIGGVIYA